MEEYFEMGGGRVYFLFLARNILFVQVWSQNLKLFVRREIWYLDQFEEFSGGVHFIYVLAECFFLIFRVFGWDLVPRLFWIYKNKWWWSILCFRHFFASFIQKIHLAFWGYLSNIPGV